MSYSSRPPFVPEMDAEETSPERSGIRAEIKYFVRIATQSVLPLLKQLGMGFVALMFAFITLLKYRHEVNKFYTNIDWDLIIFL